MSAIYADLILGNANIVTMDPSNPGAEAIAVKGSRIWRIGSNKDIRQVQGPDTQMIDCAHRTLIPGFIDAHCHLFSLVRKLFSVDLSPAQVGSIDDIKKVIGRKVRYIPAGRWISGSDYNEFYLAEKRHPARRDLDEAAPHHPVILTHRSRHACVLNSLALKLIGINNETEELAGGMIDRDLETGEPNGILFEMLDFVQARMKVSISADELDWGFTQANQLYLSLGITSLGEATVTNDLRQWHSLRQLKESGKIQSRIYMMGGATFLNEFREAGLVTGTGDEHLRMGSLKIVLSEATGPMLPSQEDLNQIILNAEGDGYQVAIHAVERTTVEAAIIALELSQGQNPGNTFRHRIEHCSECPPDLRQRLGRLRAVIVSQPSFIYYSGERYLAQVTAEAQKWLYPFQSLIDNGLVVAGSSDSPIVSPDPLKGIFAAVTRLAESGQTVLETEIVTVEQALAMYTRNAAYASREENIKGALSPGKLADMVLLSASPLQSPPSEIKNIQAEMTVIGGKIVWQR